MTGVRHDGVSAYTRTSTLIARICHAHGFARTSIWSFTKAQAAAYTTVTRESYIGFGAGAGSRVNEEFWFNTFSVPEYNQLSGPRPAIRLKASEQFRRVHWLYWQIYETRIDAQQYEAVFHRDLTRDFRLVLTLMRLLGWMPREGAAFQLSERGARWLHCIQMLFSLTFIDDVMSGPQCQRHAWPERIML